MAKILYCGDAFVQTGFGRVAAHLLPILAKEHDVHVLAVNYWGDYCPEAQNYKVYPAGAHGNNPFGTHRIASIVEQIKPDLIWTTNDFWVNLGLWEAVKTLKDKLGFKFYSYSPIDSYGISPDIMQLASDWDGFGTYTKFGAEEIRKAGYESKIDIIPHGVDKSLFFPIDQNESRRDLGVPEDIFIVFNGNRNQSRKRIDITIKSFIKFAKDKPDARLWLNMGVKDLGWDLVPLFKRISRDEGYDVKQKLILVGQTYDTSNCLPIETLNKVYNACDIGINTCIAEGWGLVNFEHAATRKAQVVPDHTSLKEIFYNVPRMNIESWEVDRDYSLDRGIPSADHGAELLSYYYNNRDVLRKDADWCYERVCEPAFEWDNIGKQLLSVVNRTLNSQPPSAFKGFGTPTRIN